MRIENPLGCLKRKEGVDYPLHIRNKEKTFNGFIEKKFNAEIYSEIVEVVKNKGWRGSKAFFYAVLERTESGNFNAGNNLKINVTRDLVIQYKDQVISRQLGL